MSKNWPPTLGSAALVVVEVVSRVQPSPPPALLPNPIVYSRPLAGQGSVPGSLAVTNPLPPSPVATAATGGDSGAFHTGPANT